MILCGYSYLFNARDSILTRGATDANAQAVIRVCAWLEKQGWAPRIALLEDNFHKG